MYNENNLKEFARFLDQEHYFYEQGYIERMVKEFRELKLKKNNYMMFVKIEHAHKCTCIAKAPAMTDGRNWFIGKLDEHLPEYPHETHCLHLKTEYKDVTFLCNEADFRNLMIICRVVVGQPNESWMQSMVEAAKIVF